MPFELLPNLTLHREEGESGQGFCVQFAPDGSSVAAGFGDGSISVFEVCTGRRIKEMVPAGDRMDLMPVTSLRWRPSQAQSKARHILVSADAGGSIRHWHVGSGKCLHTIGDPQNPLYAFDYNEDGSSFATAGNDLKIRVYDEATKQQTCELGGDPRLFTMLQSQWNTNPPGSAESSSEEPTENAGSVHSNRIFSVKYCSTAMGAGMENLILTGGWDQTVQFW